MSQVSVSGKFLFTWGSYLRKFTWHLSFSYLRAVPEEKYLRHLPGAIYLRVSQVTSSGKLFFLFFMCEINFYLRTVTWEKLLENHYNVYLSMSIHIPEAICLRLTKTSTWDPYLRILTWAPLRYLPENPASEPLRRFTWKRLKYIPESRTWGYLPEHHYNIYLRIPSQNPWEALPEND